ncbi:MAG: CopG family transcriptional regulator [Thermoanaerobaculia bacterium]
MRTTLDIDEDVLQAAKELAASRSTTAGRILSDLARKALQPRRAPRVRNGVPLMPRRPRGAPRPTMALVNRLRDDA